MSEPTFAVDLRTKAETCVAFSTLQAKVNVVCATTFPTDSTLGGTAVKKQCLYLESYRIRALNNC